MGTSFQEHTKHPLEVTRGCCSKICITLEVRIKKIEPAKHYDVISLARAMNDDFAVKTKDLFSPEVEAVREAIQSGDPYWLTS